MTESSVTTKSPSVPPRWFIRSVWLGHRALHRLTGGRLGLWLPKDGKWGTLRLTTVGRRSGQERNAILGYLEDGENLVTLAMNGWGRPEPAWWLNLLARPEVTVVLADGPRAVHARAAVGAERDRLWSRFRGQQAWGGTAIDGFAQRRPRETAVVVFEPRS